MILQNAYENYEWDEDDYELEGNTSFETDWLNSEKITRITKRNQAYSIKLGWIDHFDSIILYLGFFFNTPGPEEFIKAIIRWQNSNGLKGDGQIGPNTWGHMLTSLPIPGTSSTRNSVLKNNIVAIAKKEWQRWNDGGRKKERQAEFLPIVQDYWKTGTNISFTKSQLSSIAFQIKHPWSAAFISWVMRKAGAGNNFRYSAAHWRYTCSAKKNKINNNDNPFKAYPVGAVKPEIGDIVCKRRSLSTANYKNICRGHKTHGDIIVLTGKSKIQTIGGNLSDSVSIKQVALNEKGLINDPKYFSIIKVGK